MITEVMKNEIGTSPVDTVIKKLIIRPSIAFSVVFCSEVINGMFINWMKIAMNKTSAAVIYKEFANPTIVYKIPNKVKLHTINFPGFFNVMMTNTIVPIKE